MLADTNPIQLSEIADVSLEMAHGWIERANEILREEP